MRERALGIVLQSGDAHVPFWESRGVRFPGATQPRNAGWVEAKFLVVTQFHL